MAKDSSFEGALSHLPRANLKIKVNAKLKVKLHEGATLPAHQTKGSAGLDLCAASNVTINPGERVLVGTGVRMEIPQGYVGLVFPRSGLASRHGISLVNSVGVIDSDYRGEIGLPLINHASDPYTIRAGDRVAQIVFVPFASFPVEVVDSLSETERGEGGFGSTGVS